VRRGVTGAGGVAVVGSVDAEVAVESGGFVGAEVTEDGVDARSVGKTGWGRTAERRAGKRREGRRRVDVLGDRAKRLCVGSIGGVGGATSRERRSIRRTRVENRVRSGSWRRELLLGSRSGLLLLLFDLLRFIDLNGHLPSKHRIARRGRRLFAGLVLSRRRSRRRIGSCLRRGRSRVVLRRRLTRSVDESLFVGPSQRLILTRNRRSRCSTFLLAGCEAGLLDLRFNRSGAGSGETLQGGIDGRSGLFELREDRERREGGVESGRTGNLFGTEGLRDVGGGSGRGRRLREGWERRKCRHRRDREDGKYGEFGERRDGGKGGERCTVRRVAGSGERRKTAPALLGKRRERSESVRRARSRHRSRRVRLSILFAIRPRPSLLRRSRSLRRLGFEALDRLANALSASIDLDLLHRWVLGLVLLLGEGRERKRRELVLERERRRPAPPSIRQPRQRRRRNGRRLLVDGVEEGAARNARRRRRRRRRRSRLEDGLDDGIETATLAVEERSVGVLRYLRVADVHLKGGLWGKERVSDEGKGGKWSRRRTSFEAWSRAPRSYVLRSACEKWWSGHQMQGRMTPCSSLKWTGVMSLGGRFFLTAWISNANLYPAVQAQATWTCFSQSSHLTVHPVWIRPQRKHFCKEAKEARKSGVNGQHCGKGEGRRDETHLSDPLERKKRNTLDRTDLSRFAEKELAMPNSAEKMDVAARIERNVSGHEGGAGR
jgi:hypothetical protein